MGMLKIVNNERGEVDAGGFLGTPEGAAPPADAPPADAPPAGPVREYPEGFDDSLKDTKAFDAFYNNEGKLHTANLMKSYAHLQGMVGRDKIIVPTETTTDEQWKETFHKLGLPEDAQEYTVKNNVPEGLTPSEEMFNGFKEVAYKANILPKQAQAVADYYNDVIAKHVTLQSQATEEERTKTTELLKTEWGEKYEPNLKLAQRAIENFADEATLDHFKKAGFMQDPQVAKLFAKIGLDMQAEDSTFHDTPKNDFSMNIDEVTSKIRSMFDPSHPLQIKKHPDHRAALEEYQKLTARKVAMQGKNPKNVINASTSHRA